MKTTTEKCHCWFILGIIFHLTTFHHNINRRMPVVTAAAATSPSSSSYPRFSFPSLPKTKIKHKRNRRRRRSHYNSVLLPSSYSTTSLHKWYARPPHDVLLYDALHVRPNATLSEIQKSWRRLSRKWHPDKVAVRRRRRKGRESERDGREGERPGVGEQQQPNIDEGRMTKQEPRFRNEQLRQYSDDGESSVEPLHQPRPPPPPPIRAVVIGGFVPPPPPLQPTLVQCDNQNNDIANEEGGDYSSSTTSDGNHPNDTMQYSCNSGDAEIQSDDDEEYARKKLAELTSAYEILSDDHTRLLYHRYGLIGGTDAAMQLLNGQAGGTNAADNLRTKVTTTEEQGRLLGLMGYPSGGYSSPSISGPLPPRHSSHRDNPRHSSYHGAPPHHRSTSSLPAHQQHEQRLAYLTATMTERLRPLVEGTIAQDLFVADAYRECSLLKKSPLGAQILRCVGRAYRIEGYRALRTMHDEKIGRIGGGRRRTIGRGNSREVTDRVTNGWRDVKHYASAALSSGKLVLMEQRLKKLEDAHVRQKQRRGEERRRAGDGNAKRIQTRGGKMNGGNGGNDEEEEMTSFASNIGELPGDDDDVYDNDIDGHIFGDDDHTVTNIGGFSDDEDDGDFLHLFHNDHDDDNGQQCDELEQELQHVQHKKTYSALLSVIQMEALWKITKIELSRTIREACQWILEPTTFCPSEQSPYREDWHHRHRSPPPPSKRRHSHQHWHSRRRPPPADGWVGTTGDIVPMETGRLRAAAAMILVGDIMVQCSQERTAWNKK